MVLPMTELVFPARGIDRNMSIQRMPPYSTIRAKNVRLRTAIEERNRGGSRPMLTKAFAEQLGGGNPIRCLATLVPIPEESAGTIWYDEFDGTTVKPWWEVQLLNGTTAPTGGNLVVDAGAATSKLFRGMPIGVNAAAGYTLRMRVNGDRANANVYQIWAAMPTPGANSLVYLTVAHSTGAWELVRQVAGVPTSIATGTSAAISGNDAFILELVFNGTSTWTAKVDGTTLTAGTGANPGTYATPYPDGAFGLTAFAVTSDISVNYFAFVFTPSDTLTYKRPIVFASSNAKSYYEKSDGTLTEVAASHSLKYCKLGTSEIIQAVEYGGKLYIADGGTTVLSSHGAGAGVISSNVLQANANIDFTTLGLDANRHAVTIASSATATNNGLWAISAIGSTTLTLVNEDAGVPGNDTGLNYIVAPSAKVFDPETRTIKHLQDIGATRGTQPIGCRIVERFLGRLFWAGNDHDPINWYASAEDDPLDYYLGGDPANAARAVAGNNAFIGVIGQPIRAIKASKDDYLVIAGETDTYVMLGNPAGGGSILNVSPALGCIYRAAICSGPSGEIYMLSRRGLVRTNGDTVELLSLGRIPSEMVRVNTSSIEPIVAYSPYDHSVRIWLRPRDGTTGTHWVYDITNDAYWKDEMDDDHQPGAVCVITSDDDEGGSLCVGGLDGYTREHDIDAEDDDGVEMESSIAFGPFLLGTGNAAGILTALQGTLDEASSDVTWNLYVGRTAQEAANATTPIESGTLAAGFNPYASIRAAGGAAVVELVSTGRWAMETLFVSRLPTGRVRL